MTTFPKRYDQVFYVALRKNVVIVRLGASRDESVFWQFVIDNFVDQME